MFWKSKGKSGHKGGRRALPIHGFDEQAYLDVNPDVEKAIEDGQFKSAKEHLALFGLNEIKEGLRRFHTDFGVFDESSYAEMFPESIRLVEEGQYSSLFDHFCQSGYAQMLHSSDASRTLEGSTRPKVTVLLGLPRSGLTPVLSLLGANCKSSTWFLPYDTRKEFGIEPFTDFSSLKNAYTAVFPDEKQMENSVFISESTADEKSIDFIVESMNNLKENGVEVHLLWLTRNLDHTYVSQMETAFTYWGAEQLLYDSSTYKSYVDFAKQSYLKIAAIANKQNTAIISYERIVKDTPATVNAIYQWLGISEVVSSEALAFLDTHVAGDPSYRSDAIYQDRSDIREHTWKELGLTDASLDKPTQRFVSAMQECVTLLSQVDVPCSLETYQKQLLNKYFDADYYLKQYDDLQGKNIDLLAHYLEHGWRENRNPSATFDTQWYRENFFDDGETPSLLHYVFIGQYLVEPEQVGVMQNLKIIDPESYTISDNVLLVAPKVKNPKVSIIIPAYNEENYTMACIESIIENTEEDVSYEIILMDDKSPDESARLIECNLRNVKFISNGVNLGFLQNCNKGASFARGEYLLFLNNDTNVQPGWLSSLVTLIESSDDIGMVGSRLLYPTGQQQEAGGIVWDDASGWNFGRLDDPNKPEYNYVKEADYLTGAAMMIRTSLWEEIGGFDERYVPAYYEDTDLAFEVRKHGYRALYQPKSVVVHYEGISNGTDLGSGIKKYQVVNKEHFLNKWKEVLEAEQFPNAEELFLARDRSSKKRHLLYVDHYLPHYDEDAGSKATFQYLKILAQHNIQVHFVGDNFYTYPGTPYLDALQQMGIEVLHGNWYAQHWEEWFAENGHYFDYAVLSRPHIAVKYIDTIRRHSNAKIVYMGHDLHFLREAREYAIKGDKHYLESSQKWQEAEMRLIAQCDVSYFFSNVERKEILKIDPNAAVDVVPLYIYDKFKERSLPSRERRDIMFVGGFAHSPNVDAMLWFVEKVWPTIHESLPKARFYIIGSKPPKEIEALAKKRIIVTGYVDDETLDAYYDRCKVVVAPLRYGAGIKGKIVDALYNGMPIVTTSIGAEGLPDSDKTMLIADKPKKFAKRVIKLYRDDALADDLSHKALAYCRTHFSVPYAKKKMSKVFKEFKEKK